MSTIKTVLCVLAIIVAYGVVGTMDYEDAVRANTPMRSGASTDCQRPVTESSPRGFQSVPAGSVELAAGTITIEPCDDQRDSGARHVDRN